MPTATSGSQEGGIFKMLSGLGKALGLGTTVLVTPAVFEHTRGRIFSYLARKCGAEVAYWLTWLMGGVEAYIIYIAIALTFTASITYLMATLAARRFHGG